MKFEYLQGNEICTLAIKVSQGLKGTSNHTTLGVLGVLAATVLSDLVVAEGEEALIELLEDWTAEIATKALILAKLEKAGFDFEAWASGLPTAGEA